ncbi:MAG: S-layer homology domain-containing protein, partial [Chloroflexi bacterium]|nr:S-layer homology domain-containing protein [Chloroflexota bacterium]
MSLLTSPPRRNAAYVAFAFLALLLAIGAGSFMAVSATGAAASIARPLTEPVFGPNVKANSDNTTFGQHEPGLAVSRTRPQTVVVASKDYRDSNVKHVWIDVSTDGGATWPVDRQLQMPGIPADVSIQSDPVVVARDDGRIYVASLATNDAQSRGGVFITWTDDDGATWQSPSIPVYYPESALDDKEWFAIDNTPTSPYYHRMYMMYAPGASYVASQYSTDGGATWTQRQAIGDSGTEYTYPVVGRDGTVYNFMMFNWGASQTGTIQMTKSTDGGATWTQPAAVATAYQPDSPIRNGDSFRFFAILSAAVDPNNGALYVAWTDKRNLATDGTDVLYVKSSDGGSTWGAPLRLSHDPAGVVRDHITPMLTVGADSTLQAFWLDRRLDPNNRLFDSWYSSSTDGGATWDPDTRVSTVSQDLNIGFPPGSGNAAGDYWGLDTTLNTVYVAWTDTRNGNQDIYVSRGVLGGGTATPTATSIPATDTATSTSTMVSPTSTSTAASTAMVSSTATAIATDTTQATSTTQPSATSQATSTPGAATQTATTQPTVTACTISFSDVPPSNTFYANIECLACKGIVSGYDDGTFRPNNQVTRGQIAKIVSNSVGYTDDPGTQIYTDVPPSNPFYPYINRLTRRGYMGGYPCGSIPQEPCDMENRPYFRPGAQATRGQISKIISNAAGIADDPGPQIYTDVPPGNPFYDYINRLTRRGVMGGYA